jgi:hypothetical protein
VEATMSKKKNRQDDRLIRTVPVVAEAKPRVTSFVPNPCSACQDLRDGDDKAKGQNYSRVYATVGRTRYCKCGYCGNTWKQIPDTTA